jgi:hypothetical protein
MCEQKMKYIVINDENPILFPITIPHDWFKNLGLVEDITSAGFLDIFVEDGKLKICTSGYSQKLGIGPKPGDEELIRTKFFLWG